MLSYLLYRTGAFLIRFIPRRVSWVCGSILAGLFYVFRPKIRANVNKNLDYLKMGDRDTFRVFNNFARATADFLKFSAGDPAQLSRICRVDGRERLDAALRTGRGVIIVTAHLGPWEVAGSHLASLGYRINTVALEHPSRRVTGFFSEKRRRWGIVDHPLNESVGPLLRALRRGEVVALLVDRNFTTRGIRLPFLGRHVLLPDGHLVLARRTNAPILPCLCYYRHGGTIEVSIGEPIVYREGDRGIEDAGRTVVTEIERHIGSHHDQWFAFDHLWPDV